MPTPSESRRALQLLAETAVEDALDTASRFRGTPTVRRAALLEAVPALIGYYGSGSAALAADFYDEQRELAGVRRPFGAAPFVTDRVVRQRRAVAWAAEPWMQPDVFGATAAAVFASRMQEIVSPEVARPYRDTVIGNRIRDPEAVGWRRIASGSACKFCRMLADKGAIYRSETVAFAAHPSCLCTTQPVFGPNDTGETASVMQYIASKRTRRPEEKARLRDYLNTYFPDSPG